MTAPLVLIDLRMVHGRLHGIARYALELCRRLPALEPGWRFEALIPPEGLPPDLGPLMPEIPLRRCRAAFLSPLEQPALLASLLRAKPDLFHATSFSLPALWPGALVATLHDANHLALAENYGPGRVAYYRLVVGPRAERARALITVSDFARAELARHLHLSPYRMQVISSGVDERFSPVAPAELPEFRARHGLPARYLAVVGNEKAHKNLALLSRLRAQVPIALLAGPGVVAKFGFPEGTVELPALDESELRLFYGGAQALLLPSTYEGFGLPALEAMACGTPVIAADAGALPEVVGEAGLLVSPHDVDAWRELTMRVLRDERLHKSLVEKGRERAARLTWDACARQTIAVYRRALEKGERP